MWESLDKGANIVCRVKTAPVLVSQFRIEPVGTAFALEAGQVQEGVLDPVLVTLIIVIDQADCSIPTNLINSSIIQPALVGAEFGQATKSCFISLLHALDPPY